MDRILINYIVLECLEYMKHSLDPKFIPSDDPDCDDQIEYINKCGMSQQEFSIIGGENAKIREFPSMVAIGDDTVSDDEIVYWFCGGSLISEKYVLTAAHCTEKTSMYQGNVASAKVVNVGALDLEDEVNYVNTSQNIEIKRTIPHPKYTINSVYHDIALVELKQNAKLSPFVKPICLPTDDDTSHIKVAALGWGSAINDRLRGLLQKVKLPLVNKAECETTYNQIRSELPEGLLPEMLCYGGEEGKDSCKGAGGGPILAPNTEIFCSYTLVGITSARLKDTCAKGVPALYTNVAKYLDWIEQNVWRNEDF